MTPTGGGRIDDTGRVRGALAATAQRCYYGEPDDDADRAALRRIGRVDRAHLVMLAEQRIIAPDKAARLLRTVAQVEADGYATVLSRARPRGLYLAYERAISDACGADLGGLLHTGRSRNDLNATTALLSARELGTALVGDGCRLLTALLHRAERDIDTAMAVHTHHQPAMPVTFGYYLTGVAIALHRDLDRVAGAVAAARRSPLGAHAVAGTDLPVDTARTADLLGFDRGPVHAIDAIASRDDTLTLLGAASGVAVTVSRLATDLQLWSTSEVGYVRFPDWLVGGSSAMPQKRNPFLLEYLRARPGTVVSAWARAMSTVQGAPFSNSIEVGTEAMSPVTPALRAARDVTAVAALVVSGTRLAADRTRTVAASSYVDATALANELVRRGVPFREAHERIGAAVLDAVDGTGAWPPDGLPTLGPLGAADRARYGGGPGARHEALATARELRTALKARHDRLRARDRDARARLDAAVRSVCAG